MRSGTSRSGMPVSEIKSAAAPEAVGTTPAGASDERSAAAQVRQIFTDIAPRYDLLNHVLSCNIDRVWWNRTARTFSRALAQPQARVLDLCCGTGDMALALIREAKRHGAEPEIVG